MRCKTSERFLSDRLGGTLPPAEGRRLDAHLAACPACRAALRCQERLQASARAAVPPDPGAAYWENSLARLRAKLEALPAGGPAKMAEAPRPASRFQFRPRWAWGGVVSFLAAAAGLYIFVLRGGTSVDLVQFGLDDSYGALADGILENPNLEQGLATTLQSAIGEHLAGMDNDVHHLLYRPSDFLESLSDDEIQVLDAALGKAMNL